MRRILLLVGAVFFMLFFHSGKVSAQDLHYTQFYNSPLNINPGLTGVFNGDKRFMASFRDQWRSVRVPWLTFSGAFDMKLYPNKRYDKGFFGVGLSFNYDRQGLSALNLTNVNLLGSYTHKINDQNLVTVGLLVGYASRGFSQNNLTWDQQWTGDVIDLTLPNGENFDRQRLNFIETGVGLNYRWQKSARTKFDIGAGAYHIASPATNFYDLNDAKIPLRLSLYAITSFKLLNQLDLQVHGLHQRQTEYIETVFGALAKIHLNQKRGKELELHLGASYRTSESLAPTIAIQKGPLYAGFSYDLDLSFFDIHTDKRGGPEFHIRYIITDVKPLGLFKTCPIY